MYVRGIFSSLFIINIDTHHTQELFTNFYSLKSVVTCLKDLLPGRVLENQSNGESSHSGCQKLITWAYTHSVHVALSVLHVWKSCHTKSGTVESLWDSLRGIVESFWGALRNSFKSVWHVLRGIFESLWEVSLGDLRGFKTITYVYIERYCWEALLLYICRHSVHLTLFCMFKSLCIHM